MVIKDIQRKLKTAGFNPGHIDGDWGPLTQAAMDAFQRSGGIQVPPWLPIAERELGVSEIAGKRHNKRILEYHAQTSLQASSDEVPWCSSFVNYCMKLAGVRGTNSAAAASWLEWGTRLKDFEYGAVVVFSRTGGNHVGFAVAADAAHIAVLGGNQSNAVNVKLFPRPILRGFRWAA